MNEEKNGHQSVTLLETALRLQGDFRRRLAPLNITPLQAAVLLHVQRNEGVGLFGLADALSMRPPTLAPLVHGLVVRGLLKEKANRVDRRTKPLVLSAKGRALLPRILRRIESITM